MAATVKALSMNNLERWSHLLQVVFLSHLEIHSERGRWGLLSGEGPVTTLRYCQYPSVSRSWDTVLQDTEQDPL